MVLKAHSFVDGIKAAVFMQAGIFIFEMGELLSLNRRPSEIKTKTHFSSAVSKDELINK